VPTGGKAPRGQPTVKSAEQTSDHIPNMDLVCDAHQLPYADNSVDTVFCEAIFGPKRPGLRAGP
jgi:predicted SAM-dependent methyltransferase